MTHAGFQAIAVYRFGVWARSQRGLFGRALFVSYRIVNAFIRAFYSIELPYKARIGSRLWIPHPAGVVVSPLVEIGDDCLIRQGTTIGLATVTPRSSADAPKIGNGVATGAGAVIIGGVTIGDGARIGPNAVVMTDVPSGGSAFAAPAKIMPPLVKRDAENDISASGSTE